MSIVSQRLVRAAAWAGALAVLAGCEPPPVVTSQQGYRGTGMVEVDNVKAVAARLAATPPIPEALPAVPQDGPRAKEVFQNVKVLGDLSVGEFTRLMASITQWVAPEQGCLYCHDANNLAADTKYQKVVSRRMIEMTRHINGDWKPHVADTGVTCYTCHRGQPQPQGFNTAATAHRGKGAFARDTSQNLPSTLAGLTSMGVDPLSAYLVDETPIRVVGGTALPTKGAPHASIQGTEGTYALMIHMSESLGVNCTYCHNSQSFTSWSHSSPKRVTAFQGLRMTRDLNANYVVPLTDQFPASERGIDGDVTKVGCATCHRGANKPLGGAAMAAGHPGLLGAPK